MAEQFDQGRFETRMEGSEAARIAERERLEHERAALGPRRAAAVTEAQIATRPLFADLAYAALRVTVGSVMLAHGLLKLQDLAAWVEQVRALGVPSPATMGLLSLVAELGGGAALILGLFTRVASLAIAINMLVGIFAVHAGHGLLTKNGGFEFPLCLLMASVLFLAEGSRRFGVDARFWRGVRERREAGGQRAVRPHYAAR